MTDDLPLLGRLVWWGALAGFVLMAVPVTGRFALYLLERRTLTDMLRGFWGAIYMAGGFVSTMGAVVVVHAAGWWGVLGLVVSTLILSRWRIAALVGIAISVWHGEAARAAVLLGATAWFAWAHGAWRECRRIHDEHSGLYRRFLEDLGVSRPDDPSLLSREVVEARRLERRRQRASLRSPTP